MRNKDNWTASKFVYNRGRLAASRDAKEVSVSSRLVADIIAAYYDENIKLYCSGNLIDLGCGKVPLYATYKNYVSDNICVDWGKTAHNSEYIDVECDLTKKLPFDDNQFDTALLSDVLEHIPNPDHLWQELSRILTNDGKAILNVPFFYRLHESPHDYYRYTEYALRRFAELSGFSILLLKPIGGFPEICADLLAKQMVRSIPLLGKPMSIVVQFLALAFIRTQFGKKFSAKTSKNSPLGYFMVVEKKASE